VRGEKGPLYRKVNTATHGVKHGSGRTSAWDRNTKATKREQSSRGSMHSGQRHGFDYTPLFRFLLSKVGQDWDVVHSEAKSRLDKSEPIFWMVAIHEEDRRPAIRHGESSYYSGLYVDNENRLAVVAPEVNEHTYKPQCACCTHTFNGIKFSQIYKERGASMSSRSINLADKLSQISTHWDPHVVADYNDNDVMVVKFQGEFPFHKHPDTDDFFLVIAGEVLLDVEDETVTLKPGELFVVPKGVTHRPRAVSEAQVLLIEPKGTPNTGDPATAAKKPRL